MIPPFDDDGRLPPGVHAATLDDIFATDRRGNAKGMVEGIL
jgi:hypothetical protein